MDAQNHGQKAGIAVPVFHSFAGRPGAIVPLQVSRLGRFLAAPVSTPRFAFDEIEFSQLDCPQLIEVAERRLLPLPGDCLDVGANRGLRNAQLLGDLQLGVALQEQLGHLLAAPDDLQLFFVASGHASVSRCLGSYGIKSRFLGGIEWM